VLQDGEYIPVGSRKARKGNVRVIAATHQNLEERVRQGVFREDLFHRLNVIRLRLPPLRERKEDVPALAGIATGEGAELAGVEDGGGHVLRHFD
jgi:two-component system nitrogen regulation response regulator GlnG